MGSSRLTNNNTPLAFLENKMKHIPYKTCIDEARGILYIVDEDGAHLGGIGLKPIDEHEMHYRVFMAITHSLYLGHGWWLYLHALAWLTSQGKSLSADPNTVMGHSIIIWEKLFALTFTEKAALPCEYQEIEYNNEYFDELALTNPTLSTAEFDEYGELSDEDLALLFANGELQPHLYNLGFKITHADSLSDKITSLPLSDRENQQLAEMFDMGFLSS